MFWQTINFNVVPMLLGAGITAGLFITWIGSGLSAGKPWRILGALISLACFTVAVIRLALSWPT